MKHLLNWNVGFCDSATEQPKETFPAAVPGAVQLDYAKAYTLPDYKRGTNYKQFKWTEDKFWVYTASFDATDIGDDEHISLFIGGIDYKYEIWINGSKELEYEGMYASHSIPMDGYKKGVADIKIVIYPVPKSDMPDVHADSRDEANQSCKPAVSYAWDFHPRLVPLGIWEDIYVEQTRSLKCFKPEFGYKLSSDLKTAQVEFEAAGFPETEWELISPDGVAVFSGKGEKLKCEISDVKLWWCNGYGEPALYTLNVRGNQNETVSKKIGFKKVELVKAEGSWEERLDYPMSRNTPPITVKLNGKVIFTKGSNWVCPEIFYGTLDRNRYYEQLKLVKEANLNFLRCWGGAIINKDSFFEICDELGIMIWQEFPLACNTYHSTEKYISVFKKEAKAIIERIKSHVCLMLWCGGNELFNNWSLMTEQDDAIRIMNKLTYELTPGIPFISTAPVMGMAHGPYNFTMQDGREIIEVLAKSHNTAYTEFGGPGFSTRETLSLIATEDELSPMDENNEIAKAHGCHWMGMDINRYFGKVESLDELIGCGQFLQCVGKQFVFEEARRQKPYCSIVSNWCFNEPWPNTGNNSLVSYPNSIKPAYYSVKNACRSVLASARYRKLVYKAGEELDFDLYLLNDSLNKVADGKVGVFVQIGDAEKEHLLDWDYKNVDVCTNKSGPTVRYKLPAVADADSLKIILEAGEYSTTYTLLYRLPAKRPDVPKKMNAILDENA